MIAQKHKDYYLLHDPYGHTKFLTNKEFNLLKTNRKKNGFETIKEV